MRNITKTFLVAFTLLLALPLTMAQADITNEVGQETNAREVMPFETIHGAEMRLLQLERAIHRNILNGETIIESLDAELENETIIELEAILQSMIDLKEEVSAYDVGTEDDVENFVSFRQEASALTKEFRDTVRETVDEERAQEIRTAANERARDAIAEYQENINERARAHNEEITQRRIEVQGIISEDLLEKIRTGEIEPQQIREEVLNLVRENLGEQASDAIENMREDALRQEITARENINRIREEVLENNTARAKERIQEVRDRLPDDLEQNISERIKDLNERIQNRGGIR